MKLYYTPASPFAACVTATIQHLNISDQVELIQSHPFDNNEQLLTTNPLGRVPCLIVANEDNSANESILDSEVICDYLDANISGGLLFEAIYANWQLKTFYSICNGLIDSSVLLQMEVLRDKQGNQSEFWLQRHNYAIKRTLIEVEKRLPSLPNQLTIIHITLFCALGYLDFRHENIEWRKEHKELNDFFDLIKKDDSFSVDYR